MAESTSESARLEPLTQLAQQAFEPLDEAQSQAGFDATRARLALEGPQARRRWQAFSIAAAALLLLVVGALTVSVLTRSPALTLNVEGTPLLRDGVVRASAEQQPSLRFSDGTRIAVGSSAALRVRSIDAHGARIAVEQGEIRADVVHAALASWVFEAGPFEVDVKGTSFVLAWSSAAGRLDVRLERGLLAIHLPFTSQPISLQSGQRLVATTHDQRFTISALSAPEASSTASDAAAPATPPATLPAAPPATPASGSVAPGARISAEATRPAWAERFAAGDFGAIVTDAEQQGLPAALGQRGLEELALLADAARYTGKTGIARRALLAQRTRFGKSARAVDAAFMLGRLEEAGDPGEAVRWYERYLAEAPRGSYAAQVMGRKLLLVERWRGAAAARPLAEEYAKKYPRGPHAQSAQRILNE